MSLFTGAEIKLLSDKWRETAALIVLTVCVAGLGGLAFALLRDLNLIFGTLGLIFVINRKPLGLDLDALKKGIDSMRMKKP
jgi:hypothetical protein